MEVKRWWRYAVLRGDGIPAYLDGVWFDLEESLELAPTGPGAVLEATNRWEQREDGAVAVVYEWTLLPMRDLKFVGASIDLVGGPGTSITELPPTQE